VTEVTGKNNEDKSGSNPRCLTFRAHTLPLVQEVLFGHYGLCNFTRTRR
jgi:hypothetical protein